MAEGEKLRIVEGSKRVLRTVRAPVTRPYNTLASF